MAFDVLSKRYSKTDIPWCCSATMADQVALKLNRTASRLPARSVTMADQVVLKRNFMPIARASSSATVADRAVLKRVVAPNVRKKVQ